MRREEPPGENRRRSYRRSDDVIREEIWESLTATPDLDVDGIEVSVEGGEVTLTGTVNDPDARLLAEEIAEEVTGVRTVVSDLQVTPSR